MQTTQKEWQPGLVALYLAYRGEEGVLLGARRPDGCFRGVSNSQGWWGSWGNLDEWLTGASCRWSGHPHWGDPVWIGTCEEFEVLRARAETPADLLRLAREATAEQESDAVAELDAETETIWRSDFEELAYMTPGRTVLRFRGLDDVSLPDANARAMAAQILCGNRASDARELAGWSPLDVTRAALRAKHTAEAIGCDPADLLRDVKGLVEQRDEARQLANAWRFLDTAAETKLEELEGRNALQSQIILDYLEVAGLPRDADGDARAGLSEIARLREAEAERDALQGAILRACEIAGADCSHSGDYAADLAGAIDEIKRQECMALCAFRSLRAALGKGFARSSAETCAAEISRLVALADAVREIVGGPADAETLRAKFEETSGDIPRMLSAWLGFEVKRVSCSGDGWAALATAFDETRHGLVVDRLEQRSDSFGGERSSLADLQVVRPPKING